MKRKVINISGNCMMVSLPAKWVAKHNIKKGDEVEVEEKAESLRTSDCTKSEVAPGREPP